VEGVDKRSGKAAISWGSRCMLGITMADWSWASVLLKAQGYYRWD